MLRSASEMLSHCRETIGERPPRLIGASTTLVGSRLYLFGGSLASAYETRLLSALYVFDLELLKWERIKPATGDPVPVARYFHTADIWNNHLVVFGGLGARGNSASSEQLQVLNDVRMFNISTRRWLPPSNGLAMTPLMPVPRPRYAHLSCISSNHLLILGGKDFFGEVVDDVCVYDLGKQEWVHKKQYAASFDFNHAFAATSSWHIRVPPSDSLPAEDVGNLVHPAPVSYSERVTNKSPSEIYVYNSEHLQRRLDVLSFLPGAEIQFKDPPAGATSQPPSLHFPSCGVLGNTLVLAGNSPAQDKDSFFLIWTLNLATNLWSPINTNEILKTGSWAKACLWHRQNKLIIFPGHPAGSCVDDRLALGWDEVAVVDLEALGIYHPPSLKMDATSQSIGLASLADGRRADFDFLCEDGRRIPCWRKVIAARWPWFKEQQDRLGGAAASGRITHGKRTEIMLTRTTCSFSQSYPVTMALLQYFYSMALGTPLQRAPAVLSYLLLISTEFEIPHLQALVKHAMHLALSEATAAGVYEIAASCGCRSLQIRAFTIHANRKKFGAGSDSAVASRPTGRARSNSEGTGLNKHGKRFGVVRAVTGFAPSAFAHPLRGINHDPSEAEVPAVPYAIPRVSSPTLVARGRTSEPPLPSTSVSQEPSTSPKTPQLERNADRAPVVPTKIQSPATGNFEGQRKRSKSVGAGAASRIPRSVSRQEQVPSAGAATRIPRPASRQGGRARTPEVSVPVAPTSRGTRPFARSIRPAQNQKMPQGVSRVEGPRQQLRGRKVDISPKGEENVRWRR